MRRPPVVPTPSKPLVGGLAALLTIVGLVGAVGAQPAARRVNVDSARPQVAPANPAPAVTASPTGAGAAPVAVAAPLAAAAPATSAPASSRQHRATPTTSMAAPSTTAAPTTTAATAAAGAVPAAAPPVAAASTSASPPAPAACLPLPAAGPPLAWLPSSLTLPSGSYPVSDVTSSPGQRAGYVAVHAPLDGFIRTALGQWPANGWGLGRGDSEPGEAEDSFSGAPGAGAFRARAVYCDAGWTQVLFVFRAATS